MSLYDRLYNQEKNSNRMQSLAQALQSARVNNDAKINAFQPVNARESQQGQSALGGASDLLSGAGELYKGIQESGLFNKGNGLSIYDDVSALSTPSYNSNTLLGNAINDNVLGNSTADYGIFGNAANDAVMGTASDSSLIGDAIGNSTGGSFMGNVAPYGGMILGGMRAGQSALSGGSFKDDVPQAFFGIDDSNDSEIMQGLKGAGTGAMMGAPFGPIGMAVGAALGLGSSLLDDIHI